jgi:condensation domain-containing protein
MTLPTSLWQTFALAMDKGRPGFAKGPWFTMNAVLELSEALNADALATAFRELQQRHEVLRTEIGDGVQLVHDQPTASLELVDEVTTHAEVPLHAPVRLRLAGNRLSLHLHHMVSDPVTLWAALDDLAVGYTATLAGEILPPPAAQYADYSTAEAEQVRRTREPASAWWQEHLKDAKPCPQPVGSTAAAFAFREDLLSAEEVGRVERLTKEHRSTTLVALLSALIDGMNPHLGPGDSVVFSTLFSKRDRPAWQNVLGPCIVPSLLTIPRDAELTAVREAVVGCSRYARFPRSEQQIDPRTPFFEYVPQQWPPGFSFGKAKATVVAAAGPKDTGLADTLAIRIRTTTDGVLTGHFSGDGTDWTGPLVRQLIDRFRSHLLE